MAELVQLIVNYGVLPVVLGAILFLLIKLMKENSEQRKANENQQKQLTGLTQSMLESITQVYDNTNPHHSRKEEEENMKVNLLVASSLQNLLVESNGNRACCFLFHNGGKDVSGRSFQKMSMCSEQVDGKTVPVMSSYQNIPRMMFPGLMKELNDKNYYYVEDIEDIKLTDATSYQAFFTRGTKSVFICGMKTTENIILGYVGIEFSTNKYKDLNEVKKQLLASTSKVSGILEAGQDLDRGDDND